MNENQIQSGDFVKISNLDGVYFCQILEFQDELVFTGDTWGFLSEYENRQSKFGKSTIDCVWRPRNNMQAGQIFRNRETEITDATFANFTEIENIEK